MRINDEQHQFGGVNDITGDPRIYGRVYIATGGRGILYGDVPGVVNSIEEQQQVFSNMLRTPSTHR